ncbi:hypothetical protein E2562_029449 [Oryza meyeriana var. granulata]|uniref:Uncharacterized protein n=1 Tax=Oryza meyeriana var. granulata TaxID=110450 RepID=A0A6G1E4D0_9ORYZ|nr:hypothetical protein E2562_029449 [Oryza meyeriana var. granulata]
MNDRYDVYHFIASEIIFNNKSYEDVLKLIRDGHVELHYALKELSTPQVDNRIDDLVHRLVDTTRAYMPTDAQQECGMFKDWVCQQDHLGDVVYVELPEVGSSVPQGKNFGAVVNASPYERGWIIVVKISDSGELNSLMNDKNYSKFCKEEDGKY